MWDQIHDEEEENNPSQTDEPPPVFWRVNDQENGHREEEQAIDHTEKGKSHCRIIKRRVSKTSYILSHSIILPAPSWKS